MDIIVGRKSGNLYSDQSVGQSLQTMLESHTVSAFPLMEKYSCSTELMF